MQFRASGVKPAVSGIAMCLEPASFLRFQSVVLSHTCCSGVSTIKGPGGILFFEASPKSRIEAHHFFHFGSRNAQPSDFSRKGSGEIVLLAEDGMHGLRILGRAAGDL